MSKHELALQFARRELGVVEEPYGSNSGVPGHLSGHILWFQAATWLGGTGWPWCVAFALWCLKKAGFIIPWLSAGAWDLYDRARKAGWTVPIGTWGLPGGAEPGDICIWNVGDGHASLLVSYDRASGMVTSIDGNVSNRVAYKTRSAVLLRGVIHIPEAHKVKPAKPPMYEVVTGVNGKVIYVSGPKAIGRFLAIYLKRKHPGTLIIRRKRNRNQGGSHA